MRQKLRRLLLISLCAVLIAGSAPDAYVYTAAGAEETILEESAGENVEESPAEESDDPPVEIEPAPEPEPEMTPEPEITPEPAPEATLPAETPEAEPALTETPLPTDAPVENAQDAQIDSEPAINYAETADHSPEFREGYAMITRSNAAAWDAPGADAETIARLSRGAVWVLSRTDAGARYDRLKVTLYTLNSDNKEVIVCWMDADSLRPMNPEPEIEAYLNACAEADDAAYADTARRHPLLPIDCEFVPQNAPEAEIDPAPEASDLVDTQEAILPIAVEALAPDTSLTIAAPARIGARMQGTITIAHEPGHFSAYELEYDASAIEITASETDVYTYTAKSVTAPRIAQLRAVNEAGDVLGTAEIEVLPAPEIGDIYFESDAYALGLGDTESVLRAQIAQGKYCEFAYTSSDPETLSIDEATGAMQANAATADDAYVTITVCDKNNPAVRAECRVRVHAAPQSIRFTSESIRMAQGERADLNARIAALPSAAAIGLSCTFESSDPDCASIDENGILTANACGTATITARAYNGASCTMTVRVLASGGAVSVSPASLSIGENLSASFRITWPEDCANLYTLEYDTGMITIDSIEEGAQGDVVTFSAAAAERASHTRINVLDANGAVIAALPVDIYPAPHAGEVYFAEANQLIEIGIGETGRAVQARCADGKMCDFIYESSDPAIVAVDRSSGALTPKAVTEGDQCAVITATAKNNPEAVAICRVIVTNAPESIYFKMSELRIGVGERFDLRDAGLTLVPESAKTQLTYSSMDDTIASVSEDGVVEGGFAGTVLISVSTHNRKTASITVTVAIQNGTPTFEEKAFQVGEGMRLTVNVLHGDDYGGSYTVESDSDHLRVLSVERDASGTDRVILSALAVDTKTDATLRLIDDLGAKIDSCTVSIYPAPDSIACDPDSVSIGMGESAKLIHIVNTPAESMCAYSYKSDAPDIVSVDADGTLTAKAFGTARIRVRASGSGAEAFCTVTVLNAPTFVGFDQESYLIDISAETPTVLQPVINEGCEASFAYQVLDETIAAVDPDGTVRPLKTGVTTVTVTTHNDLTASAELNVYDSLMPTSLAWAEGFPPASLIVGNSVQLQIVYEPETAQPDIVWSSSDSGIATVDPVTGLVTAVSYGYVTITATSQRNPELVLSFTLVVLTTKRCLKIPERRIDYSDLDLSVTSDYNALMRHMNEILDDISDVQESANEELEMLYMQGAFSEWEYGARKADIARGFSMYRFPWDTKTTQPYWKAANSENGAKDFKPKIVYFGPAYTQTNRVYNVDKLVSEKRYTSLGNGGYRLNRDNLKNGTYCGNDCSAFVSMCLWGVSDNRGAYTTRNIATSSYYYDVSNWKDLRPGDLINDYGHHVVMFLYYTNAAKTQMMILEQGGGEYGINTVSCSMRGVAYYRDGGYTIRRCCYYDASPDAE